MNLHDYQAFTDALQQRLECDPRVIGLMAAGSMARLSHQPDEWSDHDFWVIVEAGAEQDFISQHDWLPEGDQIVLYFRENMHGALKAVYATGHLLEFAVSDRQGLLGANVNDYRLLIDRADMAVDLQQMQHATQLAHQAWIRDDRALFGEFLTTLLVGICRYQRGEYLSSRQLITVSALHTLLRLISKHVPTEHPETLDNLDPLRRFEVAYPQIGQEINQLLRLDLKLAAGGLLDLADKLLHDKVPDYPTEAFAVIRSRIEV